MVLLPLEMQLNTPINPNITGKTTFMRLLLNALASHSQAFLQEQVLCFVVVPYVTPRVTMFGKVKRSMGDPVMEIWSINKIL